MRDVERLAIQDTESGSLLRVKVVPGASRDRIAGVLGSQLKLTVSTAAEKGRANVAVARLLAATFGVNRRDVELVSGHTSVQKSFLIHDMNSEQLRAALRR